MTDAEKYAALMLGSEQMTTEEHNSHVLSQAATYAGIKLDNAAETLLLAGLPANAVKRVMLMSFIMHMGRVFDVPTTADLTAELTRFAHDIISPEMPHDFKKIRADLCDKPGCKACGYRRKILSQS